MKEIDPMVMVLRDHGCYHHIRCFYSNEERALVVQHSKTINGPNWKSAYIYDDYLREVNNAEQETEEFCEWVREYMCEDD